MKLILDTKANSRYGDDITSRYHFPTVYLKTMLSAVGDHVVFRHTRDGGGGMAYFAVATVVDVYPDPDLRGHHYAKVTDYLPFPKLGAWRPGGRFREKFLRDLPEAAHAGRMMQGKSVRPLEVEDFVEIVSAGLGDVIDPTASRRVWGMDDLPDDIVLPDDPLRRIEAVVVRRRLRDASFRLDVLSAYDDRCAITRLRLVNGGGRAEAQAAHIRPLADDGPDTVQNGLALSATAH